jgi:hypothetical protein
MLIPIVGIVFLQSLYLFLSALAKHQMAEWVTHGQRGGARSGGRAKTMTHGLA